jgi:hypothetical protein
MTEASHLFSKSRIVASGLIFFVGPAGVGAAVVLAGVEVGLLLGEDEGDFDADGELLLLGAGVAVFSVVIETLGS